MSPSAFPNRKRDIPTEVKDPELVARRRRQIVDASVPLFVSQGFHKTTTRQIAKASRLSIGSLYEYVASKEDVLYLVCEAIHQEMEERLVQRLRHGGGGAAALSAGIEAYFRVCEAMSDHILLIYQETKSLPPQARGWVLEHEARIVAIFQALLERGVRDYSLKPMDRGQMELMAHNVVVLGHMWSFRRWSLGRSFSLEQYVDMQRSLLLGELI